MPQMQDSVFPINFIGLLPQNIDTALTLAPLLMALITTLQPLEDCSRFLIMAQDILRVSLVGIM